ncbi:MAG: hypothetical protein ISP91_03870 [Pseudomonadales bacterium]|jgi:hypothetical protein|nr:hypothetical protein [Pseudomonadales bacterium]
MNNLIRSLLLCFLLAGHNALAQVTQVEEKLLLEMMNTLLEAAKPQDMATLERHMAEDFEQISEAKDGPDPMDYEAYVADLNEWFYQMEFYDYKVRDTEVFRLPEGAGYGLKAHITDMYFIDGSYEREDHTQTWHIRNTPDGFKVFKLVLHD